MILYLSGATAYPIYDDLFNQKLLIGGYQAQKFNHNLIKGLSKIDEVICLSALPYIKVNAPAIEKEIDGVSFFCIKNRSGLLHKLFKMRDLLREGKKLIRKKKPNYILCDAISLAPSYVAVKLGKKFNIPVIAIVTDIPQKMVNGGLGLFGGLSASLMKKYDKFVLLTEEMNAVVNPKNRPYMVMEGACDEPAIIETQQRKKIILYSGSLWRQEAGLEYFIEGFIKANLPDVELHFYGTGEFEQNLLEICKQYPNVKYMGCITNKEMVQRQAQASLLVNPRPSGAEFCKYSFPSKTFEYMVSGTPVLMTKLPGIPDEYFNYVYTIEEENPNYVADILKRIFNDDDKNKDEKGRQAREFVLKNKNYKMQANRIWEFITQ